MRTSFHFFASPGHGCGQAIAAATHAPSARLAGLLVLMWLPLLMSAAAPSDPSEERMQQVLRRFPEADLNKDGKLTPDEARAYLRQRKSQSPAAASGPDHPAVATGAPATAASAAAAGPVRIDISSDNPVPVNPRVYGTWCEEMFTKDLVDEPEYIAALVELKFKTFLYPGGSISYYHHPTGTGGFNIRPEEVARSKQGEQSRFMREGSGPDHFEQYIRLVKASGGEALFVANVLNGTVEELDEFLTRLRAEHVPIAATILGVEMHLGPGAALGLQGYLDRIKPYIAMLKAKYPEVPIVAHSTPVGRAGDRATDSFHEWNRQLAKLQGIVGFSQYGWTEFGGQARLQTLRSGLTAETPGEIWPQYDEFVRTFPLRQIPAYQQDWGEDKKMYITQWGTHSDRNTAVQGLHVANFYFFLTQYNAAHDNYFAAATGALNLAANITKGMGRGGGIIYKEKIVLLAAYLYSKPFRHLFSGDKRLLAASVKVAENEEKAETVKALAAAGPDGRKYLYVINSGPAVPLGKVAVDGKLLPADLPVEVESVWGDPASNSRDAAGRSASAPVKTFLGERRLNGLMLEPFSLTLLITPNDARQEAAPPAADAANPAFALPLNTLGKQTYQGYMGGLYAEGRNEPWGPHADALRRASAAIGPLDGNGKPDPHGKIVVVGIGASVCVQIFGELEELAPQTPGISPAVAFVNCAKGGHDVNKISDPERHYWESAKASVAKAGFSPAQVQVAWYQSDELRDERADFPGRPQRLAEAIAKNMRELKQHFPHTRICYHSARHTTAFMPHDEGKAKHAEPRPYQVGWAVKWLIEEQAAGETTLKCDGPDAQAPLLAWSTYFWTNADQPRHDGYRWTPGDVVKDGVHLSTTGKPRVAKELLEFWQNDPFAKSWFNADVARPVTVTSNQPVLAKERELKPAQIVAQHAKPDEPALIINGKSKFAKLDRLLATTEPVRLVVFDMAGKQLLTIDDVFHKHTELNRLLEPGQYQIHFLGRDGQRLKMTMDVPDVVTLK